jgi:hypothetical protein
MSPSLINLVVQAERERQIQEAVRSAFLLRSVPRTSTLEHLRRRFGRQGKQTQTRVPTYREARP